MRGLPIGGRLASYLWCWTRKSGRPEILPPRVPMSPIFGCRRRDSCGMSLAAGLLLSLQLMFDSAIMMSLCEVEFWKLLQIRRRWSCRRPLYVTNSTAVAPVVWVINAVVPAEFLLWMETVIFKRFHAAPPSAKLPLKGHVAPWPFVCVLEGRLCRPRTPESSTSLTDCAYSY